MVSNVLRIAEDELEQTLERIGKELGEDPEYQELRGALPADWPF